MKFFEYCRTRHDFFKFQIFISVILILTSFILKIKSIHKVNISIGTQVYHGGGGRRRREQFLSVWTFGL